MIEWTFRLGDLVSFLGFAVTGLSVIFLMKGDIRVLTAELGFLRDSLILQNKKIDAQGSEISKLAEVVTVMGRYDERLTSHQKQIDGLQDEINDLKHGRGFIKRT